MPNEQSNPRSEKAEWLENPQTRFLLRMLEGAIRESEQAWSREEYVGDSMESMSLKNAKALGGVRAMQQVVDEILDPVWSNEYEQ